MINYTAFAPCHHFAWTLRAFLINVTVQGTTWVENHGLDGKKVKANLNGDSALIKSFKMSPYLEGLAHYGYAVW